MSMYFAYASTMSEMEAAAGVMAAFSVSAYRHLRDGACRVSRMHHQHHLSHPVWQAVNP